MSHVSVVIACHDYGHWLADAITSVFDEPYPANKKSIIVIDDGSSDNTTEVAIEAMADFKRREDNLGAASFAAIGTAVNGSQMCVVRFDEAHGPSFARNYAISTAWEFADIFAVLDADDMYLPGKLGKSVAKIEEDPEGVGVVYTDYDTVNVHTRLRLREYKQPYSYDRLRQECIVHSAGVINKKALEVAGFYDGELRCCEDYDLWLRIAERFMIVHIPESLMVVRNHNANSTNSVPSETWRACHRRVFEKLQAREKNA